MYTAIILLPLFGSISSGFFGRKIGVSGSQLITTGCVILITIFSVVSFFEVGFNNIPVTIQMFKWIDSESLNVLWAFNFDSLTVSMLIPVLIVSSLVHLYSVGYMSHDPHNQRFFSYLSLFTFMMVILVTANNFLLMFVGWEGVGICSYLLVSFWFTRIAANQSSISALLTNRVGDCFLTIGMFAILWSFGNVDYNTVFTLAPYVSENIVTVIGLCLLIGAMAKSSQIGLHVWLPMAMEGPTPVSALIHAATMVTAGVYLLMRSSPLIEYSSTVLMLALWTGAFTTIFSSFVGLFQQDIKKVIAYSTMSQLGMMVIAIGLSSYNIALFHLINHAFYKALLFLGAGSVIHAVADNQDFRKYGGLRPFLPLTYSVMLIASLSLVAFPFMTGFYSKDFILESSYGQFSFFSLVVYFIATLAAIFTTLYSVKVLYVTFLSNPNGAQASYKMAHEGDLFMNLPLIILAVFSIFFGYMTKDIFIGLGSGFFTDNSLFMHPSHEIMIDTEFAVPTLYKMLPLLLTVVFTVLSIIFSEYLYRFILRFKLSSLGYNIFSFFNQRFYIEMFYNTYITDLILKLGGQTTKVLDKGSIELLGPFGLEKGLNNFSNAARKLETGSVSVHALYILVGLVIYITIPSILNDFLIIMLLALLNLNLNYIPASSSIKPSILFLPGMVKIRNKPFFARQFFKHQIKSSEYHSPHSNPNPTGFLKNNNRVNFKNIIFKVFISLLVYILFTLYLTVFAKILNVLWLIPVFVGIGSYLTVLIKKIYTNDKIFAGYDLLWLLIPIVTFFFIKLGIFTYLKGSESDVVELLSCIFIGFFTFFDSSSCINKDWALIIKQIIESYKSEYALFSGKAPEKAPIDVDKPGQALLSGKAPEKAPIDVDKPEHAPVPGTAPEKAPEKVPFDLDIHNFGTPWWSPTGGPEVDPSQRLGTPPRETTQDGFKLPQRYSYFSWLDRSYLVTLEPAERDRMGRLLTKGYTIGDIIAIQEIRKNYVRPETVDPRSEYNSDYFRNIAATLAHRGTYARKKDFSDEQVKYMRERLEYQGRSDLVSPKSVNWVKIRKETQLIRNWLG